MKSGRGSRVAQQDLNVQDPDSWVLRTPEKLILPKSTSVPVEMQNNQMGNGTWQELLGMYSDILNNDAALQISNPTSAVVFNGGVTTEANGNDDSYVQNFSHGAAGSSNNGVAEFVGHRTAEVVTPDRRQESSPISHRCTSSNSCTQVASNWIPSESAALMLQKQNYTYSSNQMPNSLYTQVGSNWMQPEANNLQLVKQNCILGSNQMLHESSLPVHGYRPNQNVNSPPRPVHIHKAELSASTSFHFAHAPLTPDKGKQLKRQALSERSSVLLDDCSSQEIDKQWKGNHPSEFSQIIVDASSTCLLTPLKADNLDEIGEHGLDSFKTPDLKTQKKRKHRPKVVKERNPKTAQKPSTPKTKVSNVSSSGKRKYVHKKNIETPECQQDIVGNEGTVPTVESSAKACRRALNFDLESTAGDAGKLGKHKMAHLIEELSFQLEGLSINCRRDIDEQELHALVPYNGISVIVPYEGFDNIKRKPRPKVDIDPETHRIWNLLMRSGGSETADATDKDKEKWWEEERKVFHGKAQSFIYRMRLVQGDRRFSRWKGSVVDSVIGVFLTQNVSDHLSSSAFMSLAATFPLQSAAEPESLPTFPNTPKYRVITNVEDANIAKGWRGNMAEGKTPSRQNDMPTVQTPVPNQPTFSGNHPKQKGSVQPEYSAHSTNNNELENSKNFHLEGTIVKEPARPPAGETERIHGQNTQRLLDNRTEANANANEQNNSSTTPLNETTTKEHAKKRKAVKNKIDWDNLKKEVQSGGKRERSKETMDSLDYEAMRCSDVNKIANAIKERGMNNVLAERMKDFLNRLVDDHGSIDLEWLRDAPPDKAKDYLRSFRGLGLKSVECVRLLTLHQIAFPVDTNVGRIAVRLGWVPLEPLPESLQLHLLELYPILESIQKYLWPRLCKLDQKTLYELHYHMITFGKVFCTKNKPNCNACPLRGECRHFASAFASARLALPAPEEKNIVDPFTSDGDRLAAINLGPLLEAVQDQNKDTDVVTRKDEPIVEEPSTPEREITELEECDIEDTFYEDPDEIPTIKLNIEEFTMNLQKYMEENTELQEGDVSRAVVTLNPEAASIPAPKLKNVSRLRTEHQVYELPDSHPLLEGMDKREPDDPSPYLLAIWTPGETADSVQPPEQRCESHESGQLCSDNTCFTCNNTRESNSEIVRGTLLIPCRTATRGSFPLNGTYFQVNEPYNQRNPAAFRARDRASEPFQLLAPASFKPSIEVHNTSTTMFADHESSLNPIDVPRSLIWNLPRRTVYFGTSVTSIFRGLPMETIQFCFWRGFVCVRGFDQKQRAPRPLMARLHFTASRLAKNQE